MNSTSGSAAPPPPPPPTSEPPPGGPRVGPGEIRDLGRLRRCTDDRKLGGVAAGIARHLDIDPTVVRVLLVVSALFGGAGLLVYAAGWLLIPDDLPGAEPMIRVEPQVRDALVLGTLILAAVMLVGGSWQFGVIPWPLLIVGLVALVVVLSVKGDRREPTPPTPPTTPSPFVPTAPPSAAGGVSFTKTDDAAAGAGPESPAYAWSGPGYPPNAASTPADLQAAAQAEARAAAAAAKAQRQAAAADLRRRRAEAKRARKRAAGPSLFLPTLALTAIACGALWISSEMADFDVPAPGYPALALGVIGTMLVVGAFFGRTLGVYLLAMLAGLGMGITQIAATATSWETARPASATAVASTYDVGAGRFRLDLSEVRDTDALDGRTVSVDGSFGEILVVVPDDVRVRATGSAEGGDIRIFSDRTEGDNPTLSGSNAPEAGSPVLTLDVDLTFGRIIVKEAS